MAPTTLRVSSTHTGEWALFANCRASEKNWPACSESGETGWVWYSLAPGLGKGWGNLSEDRTGPRIQIRHRTQKILAGICVTFRAHRTP